VSAAPVGCLDEREAFEAWAELNGWNRVHLSRSRVNNTYSWRGLNEVWDAFKAGRASVSASRQEGWQLVPVEPTDAMTWAGQQARYPATNSITVIYRAMLAAAPQQAQEAQGDRHGE
jgi:hypothetical protein